MARVDFLQYFALLEADASVGDTGLQISQANADILINGMTNGDYTYLTIAGPLFTEVVKVTKVGSILQIERASCSSTGHDFKTGECLTHYSGSCGQDIATTDCNPSITSPDGSVAITGSCETGYTVQVDPASVPPSSEQALCELADGQLLSGDAIVALQKSNNGACSLKSIPMTELCAAFSNCNPNGAGGGGNGAPCTCDVSFSINNAGELIVTYADQTTGMLGVVQGVDGADGVDGSPGIDGTSIATAIVDPSGNLIVTLTDGAVHNTGIVVGSDGADGVDGADGRSIVGAALNALGELELTYNQAPIVENLGVILSPPLTYIHPQIARYSGDLAIQSTQFANGLTIQYDTPAVGDASVIFNTAMSGTLYHVTVQTLNGTNVNIPITSRNVGGFILSGPMPAGVVTIMVHE